MYHRLRPRGQTRSRKLHGITKTGIGAPSGKARGNLGVGRHPAVQARVGLYIRIAKVVNPNKPIVLLPQLQLSLRLAALTLAAV